MEVASEQPKANGSKAFLGTDAVSRYVHGDLSLPGWRNFPPKIVVILRDLVFSPQKKTYNARDSKGYRGEFFQSNLFPM